MCVFSKPVEVVADTMIYARSSAKNRQFLVYSMAFSAQEDLSMILPLPVTAGAKEDAVKFINLEGYPDFFADLKAPFEKLPHKEGDGHKPNQGDKPKLQVVDVGGFEASFVPSVQDFERLDERFRLPTEVWEGLPQYKDYGFAVFKLKSGKKRIHPMAFEFPRKDAKRLFFPTVHIHDGKVHERAEFDHALFCQRSLFDEAVLFKWEESPQPAGMFVKIDKAQGLLDKDDHVYLQKLKGLLKNEDTWA